MLLYQIGRGRVSTFDISSIALGSGLAFCYMYL